MLIAWGAAHLAPTPAEAASIGHISLENRRILIMQWMAEGITAIIATAARATVRLPPRSAAERCSWSPLEAAASASA